MFRRGSCASSCAVSCCPGRDNKLQISDPSSQLIGRESSEIKTHLCGESSVANGAFERALFGVAAVMDLEGRVASKRLEADVTCGVSTA